MTFCRQQIHACWSNSKDMGVKKQAGNYLLARVAIRVFVTIEDRIYIYIYIFNYSTMGAYL